ncbi:C6 transcription factor OefC [Penicillium angulare]|uniref:C6 transcription factor OefC n=1 Tax=Penicillium angulare TaxID=116970 RepID=UPI00253F6D96|nr:C6 transcription factor OefC [Penicillium angulare]KAJ5279305.1 C6 transcription factor OefC [Penicillium angulare]
MAIVDEPANVLKTQLIPFSLQSKLGMEAILMTSAIHISDNMPGWSALAWRYYGQVAKCIEDRIRMINTEALATEVVEETLVPIGGSNGALFSRQLRHARKLLCHCQKHNIKLNLRSFIDDSYFYNSMIDSMSWLTRSARTLQQGDLEIDICPITLCSDNIKERYPGWLCGVSHQIMEYVWYASALSRRSHLDGRQGNVLSEQIITEYKELDILFRSWQPSSDMLIRFPEHCTAAELYRITGRIYLHRTIHPFTDTTTDIAVQDLVVSFLNILKISSNMSKRPRVLYWTFVLVGTCVTSDHHREELMQWLQNAYDYSKMVNCGQTIRLLAKLWWVNDYEDDDMNLEGVSSGYMEGDLGSGQKSRCSWDFLYVMRAIRRWDALIS